jgi:hypothetical protein
MEKLIDTPGQSFYTTAIETVADTIKEKSNCAVILTSEDLPTFFEYGLQLVGGIINQIIVIGQNANNLYEKVKDKSNVFIISASCIKDATKIALNSASISKNVIYVTSNSSKQSISDLLNLIEE